MSMFALTLQPARNEMPTAFLSRLAARNGCANLTSLCSDVGIDRDRVFAGDKFEIRKLCKLAGLHEDTFVDTTVQRVSEVTYRVGQKTFDRYTFNRSEIRVCPKCLIEQDRVSINIWDKTHQLHWQVPQIESCLVHSEKLMTITEKSLNHQRPDTSLAIQNAWSKITAATIPREPDVFDIYLTRRMDGVRNDGLCDQLNIPALWRVSEAIGVTLTYEKSKRRSQLSAPALRHAVLTGFELIQAGEQALIEKLTAFAKKPENRRNRKLTPGFGELQRLLSAKVRYSKDLEPFRDFMRRYVVANYPVPIGSSVYGVVQKTLRVHTVRSAARSVNVSRDVFAALLLREGLGHLGSDGVLVMDIPLTAEIVESLETPKEQYLSQKEAARFIGVPASVLTDLRKRRVLQPCIGSDLRSSKGYDVDYLQTVLKKLFAETKKMDAIPDGISTLALATRAARCSVADIVQLILDGRLKAVGRVGQTFKICNLLVSQGELRRAFPKRPRNGYTKKELARRWSRDISTINSLIQAGVLEQERMKHSGSRMTGLLVPVDVVETYEREHLKRHSRQALS